jgi:predicted lactoylglutathione lyase
MIKKAWINLPVKDPKKSIEFFNQLGQGTEVLITIEAGNKEEVDEMVEKAEKGRRYNL